MSHLLLNDSGKLLLNDGDGGYLLINEAPLNVGAIAFRAGAGMSCTAFVSGVPGNRWTAIASIALDDATEYVATGRTVHPSRTYEARVLSWGNIDKSIPVPSGMPQASQLRCRLADTDNAWRDKLGSQTPQGRRIQVKFLQEGTSEAAADILFTGIIEEFSTGPGYVEIYAVDDLLAWMDERIPDVITPENFPEYASVKQAFLPVWLGHVVGKQVSLGFSQTTPPPDVPASTVILDLAAEAEAIATALGTIVWETDFEVHSILHREWWSKAGTQFWPAFSYLVQEFQFEYDQGVLALSGAETARTAMQSLIDAIDAEADEFAAIPTNPTARAQIIGEFRSGITSFYGEDFSTLLAQIDAQIIALGGDPPSPDDSVELFDPQGAVPLPELGFVEGLGHRWAVAMHPMWNILAVYSRLPGEDVFTPVDPASYEVIVQARTFAEYPDQTFNCTLISFPTQQDPVPELRADADGVYGRFEFGTMPAAGYEADGTLGPLRNPVDGFLIMKELILQKSATAANSNIDALNSLRNKFANGGTTMPPLYCDGVVNESMTGRELMGRFHATFQTDFFHDRQGREKLVRVDDTDEFRPVLTDHVILRNSWSEKSPNPTINRFRANYSRNYAENNWFDIALANNLQDQTDRAKIQDATVDYWFARDASTAQAAIQDRLRYTDLESYRQQFQYPLPLIVGNLELAKLLGLTHFRGMNIDGYTNREVKVIGYSIALDTFVVTLDTVVRAPQPYAETDDSEEASPPDGSPPDTEYFRFTSHASFEGSSFGSWDDPELAYDEDGDATTATISLHATGSLGVYNKLHMQNPQPFSTVGLVSVEIIVTMAHRHFGNSGGVNIDAQLFDGVFTNRDANGVAEVFLPYGDQDHAVAEYSETISAATWLALANPTMRLFSWHSLNQSFSPPVETDWPDVRLRPIYS